MRKDSASGPSTTGVTASPLTVYAPTSVPMSMPSSVSWMARMLSDFSAGWVRVVYSVSAPPGV